ncbi:MAG: hypothetical protein V1793_06960 [Pseudomonadota bacterium]
MGTDVAIEEIYHRINQLKRTAQELNQMGEDIPAVCCNTARILASVKMLEINISDLVEMQV